MKRVRVEEVTLVSQNRKPGDLMRESEPEVEGKHWGHSWGWTCPRLCDSAQQYSVVKVQAYRKWTGQERVRLMHLEKEGGKGQKSSRNQNKYNERKERREGKKSFGLFPLEPLSTFQ